MNISHLPTYLLTHRFEFRFLSSSSRSSGSATTTDFQAQSPTRNNTFILPVFKTPALVQDSPNHGLRHSQNSPPIPHHNRPSVRSRRPRLAPQAPRAMQRTHGRTRVAGRDFHANELGGGEIFVCVIVKDQYVDNYPSPYELSPSAPPWTSTCTKRFLQTTNRPNQPLSWLSRRVRIRCLLVSLILRSFFRSQYCS